MRFRIGILALTLFLLLGGWARSQSCCLSRPDKGDQESERLITGIQDATIVLLIVPWGLVGGISYWLWSRNRQHPPES